MSEPLNIVEMKLGDKRLKEFVKFPWKLYRGDPCWTPPLNGDLLGNRLLGLKGLLTRNHPYHRHAEVTHFMAYRGKEPVGRISAAINHEYNEYHKTSLGFFGFFEVVNDFEVARSLLDKAKAWIIAHGVAVMRGPGEYSNSTHERQGLLIEGFQYEPTSDLTHNPPYYQEFLERYGFQKAKDYLAYYVHRKDAQLRLLRRFRRQLNLDGSVEIRRVVMKNLRAEVHLMVSIYNQAWAQNWGFLPISDEEGDSIADSLKIIVDPDIVRFAYVNGQPAAIMGLIPDPNYALRPRWRWYGDSDFVRIIRLLIMRRRIPRIRGMFFGIKPEFRREDILPLLLNEVADHVLRKHYQESDASLILEDNERIIRVIEIAGCKLYKRWRIYDLPLK